MAIFFVLLAVIVLVGVVCLLDALLNKGKKAESEQDYGYVQGTAHDIVGASNVVPGAYRRSRNW
jgi:hypothetical protein